MKLRGIVVVVIISLAIVSITNMHGQRPFKRLNASDVNEIWIRALPPDDSITIRDKDTIEEIVSILNEVRIYRIDESGREYSGQLVEFKVLMEEGTIDEIGAFGTFIYINGICYKTKYEPCAELSNMGNRILKVLH